jgi:hypothetical protein
MSDFDDVLAELKEVCQAGWKTATVASSGGRHADRSGVRTRHSADHPVNGHDTCPKSVSELLDMAVAAYDAALRRAKRNGALEEQQ